MNDQPNEGSHPRPEEVSTAARAKPPTLLARLRGGFSAYGMPLVTGLLTVTLATIPTVLEGNDVDLSLSGVLNLAHQQALQFGVDVLCTYGPLGFLIFPCYSPHTGALRLIADLLLTGAVMAGVCLLAWRLRPWLRWWLVGGFTLGAASVEPRMDLLFDVGFLCWGLLCSVESNRRLKGSLVMFALFSAFAALAKISFLILAGLSVGLVACDLAFRGERKLACGLLGGCGATFLLGWVVAGQGVSNLGSFLIRALDVVQSYNQALGMEGLAIATQSGVLLGCLVLGTVLVRSLGAFEDRKRRGVLLLWLSLLALANWKHGFVRLDPNHAAWTLVFEFVLALGLFAVKGEKRVLNRWGDVLCAVCALLSLALLQWLFLPTLGGTVARPFQLFSENLGCFLRPADYVRRMNRELENRRVETPLPKLSAIVGNSAVDVFGQYQSDAMKNGLNYRPRPSFQSYAACSRALMSMNEAFYLSPAAPPYVLFCLRPMDDKFPPLEDAWLLRDLLINYEPVASEGRSLLLRSRSADRPQLTLLHEGVVRPGQPIDLRGYGHANLWIEIELEPTLRGRLRQFLHRPPTLRLAAWRQPGKELILRRRSPASMLAAGFMISPLVTGNDDVAGLYTDQALNRPGACSVEPVKGEEGLWQELATFRVYEIGNPLGKRDNRALNSRTGEPGPSASTEPGTAGDATRGRPFALFRNPKWHPTRAGPGGMEEMLGFGIICLLPVVTGGLMVVLARRIKTAKRQTGLGGLILANALVLVFLLSTLLMAGETFFRFFYDTTDSLGYTKVCERWVQRHWHTNAAGCRDEVEYLPAIQPGKRRLTFVGDSFTAGHGVKAVEDRFVNRLRKAHPDWEVQALANVGLDTGSELALMEKAFARGYQVDQVVLVYCLNDVGDLLTGEGQPFERVFANLEQTPWLARSSYLVDLFYNRYRAARNPAVKNYFSFVKSGYQGASWEKHKERLRAVRDLVESHGGHLSVVTFPFLNSLGPNYDFQFAHAELAAFWSDLGVSHLDLLPVLQGFPPRQLTVNRYDAHPNERANQLAADAIDRFLAWDGAAPAR